MTASSQKQSTQNRAIKVGAGALGIAVLLAAVGLWWFFRDDSPEDVSLDAAIESLDDGTESTDTDTGTGTDADAGDGSEAATEAAAESSDPVAIAGTWIVDTDTGSFDYESATGSFVGFRIEEELNSIGSTTAVGRTGDIAGTMVIDGTTVTEASFEVDLTTITTESSNRDDNVQDALETGEFPTASFVLTEPMELGDTAADGGAVSAAAIGDLTVHGVTNQVSFAMEAQLVDGVVVAVGTTEITFADYGVEVPNGGPVISVDDFGVLELQFLLTQTAAG